MRYEKANLDGKGQAVHATYDMPTLSQYDYWISVTNVPCPICHTGTVVWNEAGFVAGSRICEGCGRFFQAQGSVARGISLMRDPRFDKLR